MADRQPPHRLALAVCTAGVLLAGCRTAPPTLGEMAPGVPEARGEAANGFWKCQNAPDMRNSASQRVAIVEFSVEYVTVKHETPFQSQLIAGAPPVTPVTAGLAVTGLQRRQVEFDEDLRAGLPDELYAMFAAQLVERGFRVLSPEKICASQAYERLETAPSDGGSFLQRFNYISSDTGTIKKMVVYPASGYQLVKPAGGGNLEDVERDLLEEVGADISLRVRVRVGVYRDHATVERGTVISVLSADGAGELSAERSLLSDIEVIDDTSFMAVKGKTLTVDTLDYLAAMRRVFPPFAAMGLDASEDAS